MYSLESPSLAITFITFTTVDDHNLLYKPYNALHNPHQVGISSFGLLNHLVISSGPAAETDFAFLVLAYLGMHVSDWSFHLIDGLPTKSKGSIHHF